MAKTRRQSSKVSGNEPPLRTPTRRPKRETIENGPDKSTLGPKPAPPAALSPAKKLKLDASKTKSPDKKYVPQFTASQRVIKLKRGRSLKCLKKTEVKNVKASHENVSASSHNYTCEMKDEKKPIETMEENASDEKGSGSNDLRSIKKVVENLISDVCLTFDKENEGSNLNIRAEPSCIGITEKDETTMVCLADNNHMLVKESSEKVDDGVLENETKSTDTLMLSHNTVNEVISNKEYVPATKNDMMITSDGNQSHQTNITSSVENGDVKIDPQVNETTPKNEVPKLSCIIVNCLKSMDLPPLPKMKKMDIPGSLGMSVAVGHRKDTSETNITVQVGCTSANEDQTNSKCDVFLSGENCHDSKDDGTCKLENLPVNSALFVDCHDNEIPEKMVNADYDQQKKDSCTDQEVPVDQVITFISDELANENIQPEEQSSEKSVANSLIHESSNGINAQIVSSDSVADQQFFAKEFEELEELLPDDDMGLFDDVLNQDVKPPSVKPVVLEGDRTVEFLSNELSSLNCMLLNYQRAVKELEKRFKISGRF